VICGFYFYYDSYGYFGNFGYYGHYGDYGFYGYCTYRPDKSFQKDILYASIWWLFDLDFSTVRHQNELKTLKWY
jgi:hypothetical protein